MRYALSLTLGVIFALAGCRASAGVAVEPQVGIVEAGDAAGGADRVWVCHRGRWQEVAAPAAGGHSRHGDRVSEAPRPERASC